MVYRNLMLACAVAGALAMPAAQADEPGKWSVKAGAHWLSPKDSNGSLEIPGVGKVATEVDDAVGFTFVVTYQASPHWEVELLAAAPFSHDIDLVGVGTAETKHLPPTLSWIYRWNPDGRWQPYLGAGINTTIFMDEDPGNLSLNESIGPAAVTGIDYMLNDSWFLNLDLRWFDIDTEVEVDGVSGDIGTVSIDPFAVGLMVRYRFGHKHAARAEVAPAPAPVAAAPAPAPEVASAPAACADADVDGVCDADDKCPSTGAGEKVDALGCSLVSRLTVLFDTDSAELRPESITELERVVQFMNSIPSASAVIEGHTDSAGSDDYNLKLSERRAKAVLDYLASRGVNPSRLQSIGKGEAEPVADNSTEAGRQQNRRVMLIRTAAGR